MIVDQWRRERPELDASAKAVSGRVIRLASLFQQAYAPEFEAAGLNAGDYGVLVALRRAGSPFRLTSCLLVSIDNGPARTIPPSLGEG